MSYGRLLSGSKCRLGASAERSVVARPDLVVLGDVVAVGRQRQARAPGRARDVVTVGPVAGVALQRPADRTESAMSTVKFRL